MQFQLPLQLSNLLRNLLQLPLQLSELLSQLLGLDLKRARRVPLLSLSQRQRGAAAPQRLAHGDRTHMHVPARSRAPCSGRGRRAAATRFFAAAAARAHSEVTSKRPRALIATLASK